jgi:hypothetical protein
VDSKSMGPDGTTEMPFHDDHGYALGGLAEMMKVNRNPRKPRSARASGQFLPFRPPFRPFLWVVLSTAAVDAETPRGPSA